MLSKRNVAIILCFAMLSSYVSYSEATMETKVKKIQIGAKVGNSGVLVLTKGQKRQLNCKTTPKKAKKQLVYKSSKPSVIRVTKQGVVKALKKRGSAKITVSSKTSPKKKASITVKAGTPIRDIKINDTVTVKRQSANFRLKEVNGVLKKYYPIYKDVVSLKDGKFEVIYGGTVVLKATVSPENATSKNIKWTANRSSKYVKLTPNGTTCTVTVNVRNVSRVADGYDITITATTTDGSNKKSSTTIRVKELPCGPCTIPETPAPSPEATLVPTVETVSTGV